MQTQTNVLMVINAGEKWMKSRGPESIRGCMEGSCLLRIAVQIKWTGGEKALASDWESHSSPQSLSPIVESLTSV